MADAPGGDVLLVLSVARRAAAVDQHMMRVVVHIDREHETGTH